MILSFIFVAVQFGALGLIAFTGHVIAGSPVLLALEIAGLSLGVWAVLAMGLGNFNITPDVRRSSRLVTSGPYALIRHPMYSALLLTTLPLVIDSFTPLRAFIWIVLLVDLVLKLNYEEGMLKQAHPGYAQYMKESYRILPFIY